ncbi:MAG: amino acid racemase [Candidatus Delongbacteria bacterium]|jgi:aspartate racemase|nr:amino acid racemase [Candidatus Delongbacteria bacterium]
MKKIGIIGGVSWHSTSQYYSVINQTAHILTQGEKLPECMIHSVDFTKIEKLQESDNWKEITKLFIEIAKKLEDYGAGVIIMSSNTCHKVYKAVQKEIKVPIFHIVDPTAEKIKKLGLKKVGLLGTRFIMEEEFYKDRLLTNYDIRSIVPGIEDRNYVHKLIFRDLALGKSSQEDQDKLKKIIDAMVERGAEGVILGCTELNMAIKQLHYDIPIFDTAVIHAEAVAKLALEE